jgi:hypothetical protein
VRGASATVGAALADAVAGLDFSSEQKAKLNAALAGLDTVTYSTSKGQSPTAVLRRSRWRTQRRC